MNNNQNRCGCGGQPIVMDIDRETKENTNFRKEAWTGEHLQVTLMCIPTNCDIGAEIHEDTDQLICIVQGCATISFGATKCSMCDGQRANGGDACLIPAGTWHNITNSGSKYHAKGCSYLKNEITELELEEALLEGYTPCSRCKP